MPKAKSKTPMRAMLVRQATAHPWWSLGTLSTLISIVLALAGVVGWVVAQFVLKSDFSAYVQRMQIKDYWTDAKFVNQRLERLGDNVDLLKSKRLVQGRLDRADEAALDLYQKKLDATAVQLIEAQRIAKEANKEK